PFRVTGDTAQVADVARRPHELMLGNYQQSDSLVDNMNRVAHTYATDSDYAHRVLAVHVPAAGTGRAGECAEGATGGNRQMSECFAYLCSHWEIAQSRGSIVNSGFAPGCHLKNKMSLR